MVNCSVISRNLVAGLAGAAVLAAGGLAAGSASARPSKCFGKRINRVVSGSERTVRLKYGDVAWIAGDRVRVVARPYSVVCADRGRQTVVAGKGRSLTNTGRDADRILLHKSSNRNVVRAGLGDDYIRGSAGHDFLYASPKRVKPGLADRDTVRGLGGNDRIYDYGGVGNRLMGGRGVDRIYSLGTAVSTLNGEMGSDFLYSNGGISPSGTLEWLTGERGNDRLIGTRRPNNGPAFFDGGAGDDRILGTDTDDVILLSSGVTKIDAKAGDDLIISGSRGASTVDGGPGLDTISFAAHAPPAGGSTGVTVDLAAGHASGSDRQYLANIENADGSPFDDVIRGRPGVDNHLAGGLGDDRLEGNRGDTDTADGGMGINECLGLVEETRCNRNSPGPLDGTEPIVDIDHGGVLNVIGSRGDDVIDVSWASGRYRVAVDRPALALGFCSPESEDRKSIVCQTPRGTLTGLLAFGGDGNDRITIGNSVPRTVTTSINGGRGTNVLNGGPGKDFMETAENASAGSVLNGRGGSDSITVNDDVTVNGGAGSDVLFSFNPCRGGRMLGGSGTDIVALVRAPYGVDANLARGTVKWMGGRSCTKPLSLGPDLEKIEGSNKDDRLTLGKRNRHQQGRRGLLGRHGIDVLDSRNGTADVVTVGEGGRSNRVIADRFDKIIWGWGMSGS